MRAPGDTQQHVALYKATTGSYLSQTRLGDLPVGHTVALTWMMRDSQGTYVCTAPSTYLLYAEVDNYLRQTLRVAPHAGKKRGSLEFRATDATVKIRFSTEKTAYDGCGPFFTNVQATV